MVREFAADQTRLRLGTAVFVRDADACSLVSSAALGLLTLPKRSNKANFQSGSAAYYIYVYGNASVKKSGAVTVTVAASDIDVDNDSDSDSDGAVRKREADCFSGALRRATRDKLIFQLCNSSIWRASQVTRRSSVKPACSVPASCSIHVIRFVSLALSLVRSFGAGRRSTFGGTGQPGGRTHAQRRAKDAVVKFRRRVAVFHSARLSCSRGATTRAHWHRLLVKETR